MGDKPIYLAMFNHSGYATFPKICLSMLSVLSIELRERIHCSKHQEPSPDLQVFANKVSTLG